MTVGLQDIQKAADVIRDGIVKTPCTLSRTLSEITGADLWLKFENHQFTASFKDRGALLKLLSLTLGERKAGVVAMSAGNHGQAVAYHARKLEIPSTIVMPRPTPNIKVQSTQALGAEVILHGQGLDEAAELTRELVQQRGLTLIHPYDDEQIIAGQGTIALEMLKTYPDLEVLVIPVGGGGLIAGCAIAAKGIRPDIEVVGVQTERFPAMQQALQGVPIECGQTTIAEGIAVKEPGGLTVPLVQEFVDEILLVEEGEIEKAVLLLLEVEKTVVEGAGAVGLTAVLENRNRFEGRKVGLILSGGNIDLLVLSSIIQRGLARSGRLVRLRVGIPDIPGTLAEISRIFGEINANIIEVRHQRAFTNLSLRVAEVEFVIQALGTDHLQEILGKLKSAKYEASVLDASLME
jgi:threonine dehydratase